MADGHTAAWLSLDEDMYLHLKTQGAQPRDFYCISMTTGEAVEPPRP